jgi:hypothetical protein
VADEPGPTLPGVSPPTAIAVTVAMGVTVNEAEAVKPVPPFVEVTALVVLT